MPDEQATDNKGLLTFEPQKCISNLKKAFPDAGELYGMLSKDAHMVPSILGKYIRKDKIILASHEYEKKDAITLLELADMYVVLIEMIFSDLLSTYSHTEIGKEKTRIPKQNRPLAKAYRRIKVS